jgi:hypothetical protein
LLTVVPADEYWDWVLAATKQAGLDARVDGVRHQQPISAGLEANGAPMQPARPLGQVSSAVGGVNRRAGLAKILVFDVAGPLLTYSLLKANGMSDVLALVLSGSCRPSACSSIGSVTTAWMLSAWSC